MLSSRRTIFLVIAALIAIVTAIGVKSMMTVPENTVAAAPVPSSDVLAVAHDLPTGTILKESDMKWIPWSKESSASGQFYVKDKANMNDLVGAVLREGLHADEPILVGRVVQPHEQGFLAAVLMPGKRAMSVPLTPSAGVAGFIFPGDHVDVILTHGFTRKDVNDMGDRFVSETVLSDVRVLALDQKSDNQSNDPKVASLATLEVNPQQAEKLALAADLSNSAIGGKASLSLALRSLAVDDSAEAKLQPTGGTTWDSDLSLGFPAVNGDDSLIQKVQVMRGKDKTESSFERRRR